MIPIDAVVFTSKVRFVVFENVPRMTKPISAGNPPGMHLWEIRLLSLNKVFIQVRELEPTNMHNQTLTFAEHYSLQHSVLCLDFLRQTLPLSPLSSAVQTSRRHPLANIRWLSRVRAVLFRHHHRLLCTLHTSTRPAEHGCNLAARFFSSQRCRAQTVIFSGCFWYSQRSLPARDPHSVDIPASTPPPAKVRSQLDLHDRRYVSHIFLGSMKIVISPLLPDRVTALNLS